MEYLQHRLRVDSRGRYRGRFGSDNGLRGHIHQHRRERYVLSRGELCRIDALKLESGREPVRFDAQRTKAACADISPTRCRQGIMSLRNAAGFHGKNSIATLVWK